MKKKLSTIITALMLVVVVTFGIVLPIALEDDSIYFKVSYARSYVAIGFWDRDTGKFVNFAVLLKSADELKELCETYNNKAFEESSLDYSSELNKQLREYDEQYFKNKALIIFAEVLPDSGYEFSIEKIKIKKEDSSMVLEIVEKNYGGGLAAIMQWVSLIEVNKSDVIDVNTVEYTLEERRI